MCSHEVALLSFSFTVSVQISMVMRFDVKPFALSPFPSQRKICKGHYTNITEQGML